MQKCEIMPNDLIDSERNDSNIKATKGQPSQIGTELGDKGVSMDNFDATSISSNFWPQIHLMNYQSDFKFQDESLNVPGPVDKLLSDYAKRFNEIKTPRKLLWKKSLGTVKVRAVQFMVAPVQAAIIMHSWTSKDLAAAIWVPVDVLNRRVNFWISKLIHLSFFPTEGKSCKIAWSRADSEDHVFTRMEGMVDTGKKGDKNGSIVDLVAGDEEGESSVASVEDQLRKGMTVYEMFCIADPPYDKTLLRYRLELRDGMHFM
ncbi:anaphase-promoting complex subunit 2 [Pyrus ussuriensis x Pyrus communis]|uniref:Anaphase-promoting complex subunit 2 n=1 Tax=Pyrus ussuriensis x Pyrus communis TaxID=2448454 RepID=A0A5N5IAE5_9ROSA|nr:anaphase-promoting complex subunit 2 [Pyrus ussuriensis x Pyrus communis]